MSKKNENKMDTEMPELQLRAVVEPSSVDEEARTVRVQYTTGARVFRPQFWEEDFYEELSVEPGHVRLERMQNGAAPVLNSHSNYDLSRQIGVVIDADETHCTIKFSDRNEEINGFWRDIVNGIIRNISVGYRVYKYEDITPDDDKIRVLRAIDWEPMEVSFVTIGADGGAGVRSSSKTNRCVVLGARANLNQEKENEMGKKNENGSRVENQTKTRGEEEISNTPETETPAETPAEAETGGEEAPEGAGERSADQIAQDAASAERTRASDIRSMVRSLDLDESMADDLINKGVSLDQARAEVINKMARNDENTNTNSSVRMGSQDEVLTRRSAIENALLHRHNPSKHELTDAAREYRGLSLLDIAKELIGRTECKRLGNNKMRIVERAFHSTSDFPEILANVANKSLRQSYMDTKRSFLPFCRQTTLPDFKEAKRTALSNASSLEEVVEGGKYKRGSFSDGAETIQLSTYGKIVSITRQAIINDDLDAFTRVPGKMAATAARLENRMVYDILTSNPVMADGNNLFDAANHGNQTDALLGVAGIGKLRELMRLQKDPSGEDILNIEPAFLIVPAALEVAAAQLKADLTPNQTSQVNPLSNTFDIIVEGYLDGNSQTNYFMAANPNEIDTIEFAYLDGETGPYLESKNGFDVDGLEIKVRHDFATKAIDYRGLAKSTNDAA